MRLSIKHDSKNQKFFILIGGKECALKYNKINENLLDYKLIFVPQNLRGQGLAQKIAEYAISFAKKHNIKIKPTCSFVKEFITRNKEMQDVVFIRENSVQAI